MGCLEGFVRSLQAPDNFDELHHWHWVHEVHPDDLLGPVGGSCEFGDGNGGGVAGDDGRLLEDLIRCCQNGFLDIGIFNDGFHDEINICFGKLLNILAEGKTLVEILAFLLRHLALADFLLAPIPHELLRFLESDFIGVVENHGQLGKPTGNNRNTSAHLACADNPERFDSAKVWRNPGCSCSHHLS